MLKEISINFNNFLLSLSDAIDLASPSISAHQLRTAYIAWQMTKAVKKEEDIIERIFMAALLHDIGALAPEEKVRLHGFKERDLKAHCIRGARLFEVTSLLRPASRLVLYHHKPWNKWDRPIDDSVVFESQVLYLADFLERIVDRERYILHQVDELTKEVHKLSGKLVHKDIVDIFMELSKREDFWLDLASPRLYSLLLHLGPFRKREIQLNELFSISVLFRNIIDFRSVFTATHSTGVAACAAILSKIFGLTETEVALMEIAGNLHDLGKLVVPNYILTKPGKLSKEEYEVIKQHTYFTYTVLGTIDGMDQVTEWAAFHHEKLDGTGYPFHLTGERINSGARIMAVADVFTALAEDRPYKKGLDRKRIQGILVDMSSNGGLDKRIVNLLLENYQEVFLEVKMKQDLSREYYQRQLLEGQGSFELSDEIV